MAGAQVDSGDRGDILRNKLAPLHVSSVLRPEHTGRWVFLHTGPSQLTVAAATLQPFGQSGKTHLAGSGMPAGQWDADLLGGHPEAERGRGWVAGTHQGSWA